MVRKYDVQIFRAYRCFMSLCFNSIQHVNNHFCGDVHFWNKIKGDRVNASFEWHVRFPNRAFLIN